MVKTRGTIELLLTVAHGGNDDPINCDTAGVPWPYSKMRRLVYRRRTFHHALTPQGLHTAHRII